ncbi:BMP family ABC transporter substrate-binding protein [Streptomyces sp. NPDC093984]|uniref:BMP family ABC transporter substrate-binding protein n=1 Tax=Streptomyces sp. NPDC093984 TaxID=3366052 RepID=UPI0037F9AB4E
MKTRRGWRAGNKKTRSTRGAPVVRALAAVAGALRGRGAWVAGGGAAVVVLGLVGAWLFAGEERAAPPDPRARQYQDFDACMLTGDKGITRGTLAASAWEGMQQASRDTLARVTYVPVTGPQSAGNVQPFLNSLIQRQCDVVVAVGTPQVQVTRAAAGKNTAVRFVLVDDASAVKAETAGNVTVAKPDESLKETVAQAIRQAVRASNA